MKTPKISLFLLIFIVLLSFFGSTFYTVSAYELNPNSILLAPNSEHILGTDRLGRDLLARIIEGGKTSLIIGFLSALLASTIALIVGISSAFFGKTTDKIIILIIDLFLTFPTFFLLIALASYMQASIFLLIIVICVTGWMSMARLIRSESFSVSNKAFIKILKIAHVSKVKIIFKYIAPLIAPIFFVGFTFGVSGAILSESGLSFLGIGIMPPQMSLGTILADGKEVIDIAWWLSFFPGLFIFIVTYSLISISDYLQFILNQSQVNG